MADRALARQARQNVLAEDIGEKKNLAEENSAKADELRQKLKAWQKEIGARMPEKNPNWKP